MNIKEIFRVKCESAENEWQLLAVQSDLPRNMPVDVILHTVSSRNIPILERKQRDVSCRTPSSNTNKQWATLFKE